MLKLYFKVYIRIFHRLCYGFVDRTRAHRSLTVNFKQKKSGFGHIFTAVLVQIPLFVATKVFVKNVLALLEFNIQRFYFTSPNVLEIFCLIVKFVNW